MQFIIWTLPIKNFLKNIQGIRSLRVNTVSYTHLAGIADSMENEVVGRMNFRETVEKLPETERQIMTMKLAGQMTFKEIAEVLGIPMGTVTWKYQNSLEKLRRVGV